MTPPHAQADDFIEAAPQFGCADKRVEQSEREIPGLKALLKRDFVGADVFDRIERFYNPSGGSVAGILSGRRSAPLRYRLAFNIMCTAVL